jgi:hypothetical protein
MEGERSDSNGAGSCSKLQEGGVEEDCDEKCARELGYGRKRALYRLRLGVFDDGAGFATGADGRLTRGRAESCRARAPDIGASNPADMLPPPPPLPERDRWSWGLGLERSAVRGASVRGEGRGGGMQEQQRIPSMEECAS